MISPYSKKLYFVLAAGLLLMLVGVGLLILAIHPGKKIVPPAAHAPAYAVVEITGSGFMPQTLQVRPGTKVVWVNKDQAPHQIAADPYPTHASLPALFAPQPLAADQTFSFVFTKVRTVSYHDELNPTWEGSVTVK